MRSAALLGLVLAAACAGPGADGRERPNVVLILTDDQRPDTIAALGNPHIRTPNLDRLVRSGTHFPRAVCAYPLCHPSRAEILTGCTAFRTGVFWRGANALNPDLTTWPAAMRAAGYHAWYAGKWHTPGRPTTRGFEESGALFVGGTGRPPPRLDTRGRQITGYGNWVFQTDDGKTLAERGVGLTPETDVFIADAAIGFIRRRPARPFFLHVNFTAPHDPLIVPPGHETLYDPARLPLPPNFLPEHPFDHGNSGGRDELLLPHPRTAEDVRREIADYYAVITHLDAQVGRILDALEATGQASRTVVIFTSDHGLAIGSHGLRGKQNMYEHTIGVPLVVAGPGLPRGARRDAQVNLRDLFPTACELAGIPVPATVQGKSFAPVLRGESVSLHPEVFGYYMDSQRMIRTDRWKLVLYPKLGREQLFDLSADPFELRDLGEDPRTEPVRASLRARLAAWQRSVSDPVTK